VEYLDSKPGTEVPNPGRPKELSIKDTIEEISCL
jgi:hypothetical protein